MQVTRRGGRKEEFPRDWGRRPERNTPEGQCRLDGPQPRSVCALCRSSQHIREHLVQMLVPPRLKHVEHQRSGGPVGQVRPSEALGVPGALERERADKGVAEEEDELKVDAGALDLVVPATDLAAAFALETTKTGTPAAQPDIGEGTETENNTKQDSRKGAASQYGDRSIVFFG